jgi:hypothetical protein
MGLFTHRHTPEVTEHLGLAPGDVMFSTHLLPLARGILSTLYVWLEAARKADEDRRSLSQILCRASRWCGCGRRDNCRNCSTWRTPISATSVCLDEAASG